MHAAEKSMEPVLKKFRDNVLFLKHNLNAQAIGSLQSEFSSLENDIDSLLRKMNTAIEQSNIFIAQMGSWWYSPAVYTFVYLTPEFPS